MRKKKFLDGYGVYILWFAFYFALTGFAVSIFVISRIKAWLITASIYAVTLSLAFTPQGEKLYKLLHGVRPLYTNHEKEKILPVFREVHKSMSGKYKKNSCKTELCISDSLIPNAFAMGENTLVVTKGLLESMTEEQIKGILAHEFGHLLHGDTKAAVFTFVGNGILNITALIVRKVLQFIIRLIDSLSTGMIGMIFFGMINATFCFLLFFFELFLFIVQEGGEVILMAKRRRDELWADYYAYKSDYGEELVSALYDLEMMTALKTLSVMEQLKASHPHTARRIGYLERWLGVSIKQ